MPGVDERLASLEAKVDTIADLQSAISEFRADMTRQFGEVRADMDRRFGEVRADMNRRFDDVDRRFGDVDRRFDQVDPRYETLDQRMGRHFMWMVGIQFTVLIAVIVALIQMAPR
ncbi:MAG: hypothetical protein EXQ53_06005 [Acidobacteria bacterium]|nr:hypothetical protein [Acidobacteriota bacterium]